MNDPVSKWAEFKRQPISAVWHILFKNFIELIKGLWPLILIALIRSDEKQNLVGQIVLILLPIYALILSSIEHYFFKFKITDEEVHVKKGIFAKKQVILPLNKIQGVHINQSWIQKLLKLSEVEFDSPGTEKAEVKLQMSHSDAESLIAFALSKKEDVTAEASEEDLVSNLSFPDLLRLGLTSNHFDSFLIIAGVFISFVNNIRDIVEEQFDEAFEQSTNQIVQSSFLFMSVGILAILLLLLVVSLIRVVFTYANHKVIKTIKGFNVSKGLINTSQKLVPFEKVQYLSWKTNWLRKKIPIYIFEFHTIGCFFQSCNIRVTCLI